MPASNATSPTVRSVLGFIKSLAGLKAPSGQSMTFRGQRDATWKIDPGILRPPQNLLGHEREIVRELMSVHPQEFRDDGTMFDRLVRMQHFGMPTRLLDVSANPLVALYFASEPYRSKVRTVDGKVFALQIPSNRRKYFDSDAVSCIANLANLSNEERQQIIDCGECGIEEFNELPAVDRLVQFVQSEKPHFRARIDREDLLKPYFVVPKMSNRRIIAQAGSFIVYGIRSEGRLAYRRDIKVQTITVPQNAKAAIRSELDSLGINESTLFPEIDRAASYIVRRFGS